MDLKFEILKYSQKSTCKDMQERKGFFMFPYYNLYFPEKGCHLGTNRSDNET